MLPELPPPVFASLVDVDVLPTTDYGILQILSSSGSLERYSTNTALAVVIVESRFINI